VVFGNTLFKQTKAGQFRGGVGQGGDGDVLAVGIGVGDFDNDGFEDVFLPSGMGYPYEYWPKRPHDEQRRRDLHRPGEARLASNRRRAGISCRRQSAASPPRAARGPPPSPTFTNSGQLDLVVNNFNDRPYFFRNHFPKKNYVEFRLTGHQAEQPRRHRRAGQDPHRRQGDGPPGAAAGGYLSQSSRTVHFGWGTITLSPMWILTSAPMASRLLGLVPVSRNST